MGEIGIIIVFIAGGLSLCWARIVRLRERRNTRTREWIEFLQEDLSASL
jgi:hypothetical protein